MVRVGSALDVFDDSTFMLGEIPDNYLPVVVNCAMLYQLDNGLRMELERRVGEFLLKRNGLTVATNLAVYEGYLNMEGSVSYVKNGKEDILGQKWFMTKNTMVDWRRWCEVEADGY